MTNKKLAELMTLASAIKLGLRPVPASMPLADARVLRRLGVNVKIEKAELRPWRLK